MSFVFTFTPSGIGMSASKYDECTNRLAAAGFGNPNGRLYHLCYGDPNNLIVTDVWDSRENFEKFGATLMPILNELGIDPGQPVTYAVHNIIEAPVLA
ncbi:MAG TPA: hypothetical protein VK588_03710 [Chitinophagaceae bacterium]|nr:hypothetical protein [Chitinophagaceae bacterium]